MENFTINIVYFINTYVNPTSYQYLMKSQLHDLIETGLMEYAHLWIEASTDDPMFSTHVNEIMEKYSNKIVITIHLENNYEYFGIHRVWSLNQEFNGNHSRHVTLYFHAKGITYKIFTENDNRIPIGSVLFDKVIRCWREVLTIFDENTLIDKIGFSFSEPGWIWFNFWWIRGNYCQSLERPILTERRHYYEDYLCRRPHDRSQSCFHETIRPEMCFGDKEIYHLSNENCYGMEISYPCSAEDCCRVIEKYL